MVMLTQRQQQILDYLIQHQQETGVTPSTREVQQHFGFASQTAVMSHLRALERKGAIRRLPGKARAIIIAEKYVPKRTQDNMDVPVEFIQVPLYGQIAAGMAAETEQQNDGCLTIDQHTLEIPRNSRTFALKVRGESMIDAHICDGDFVVMEFKEPKHGDIVAALIDGETTLKRYQLRNGQPYLKAENAAFPELIPARELVIQGVLLALIRRRA
jgi:repressor LexA